MTKELKLDPTTVKLKDWLSEQLKKDDQPIVQLLSVEFPIETINHQQQIQEQDFPKAAQALGLNGYVKDHHGIVFKEPLTKKLREAIVAQMNCESVTNPRNAILWLLLSTILLVISFLGLCDVIFNFSGIMTISMIALTFLGLACAYKSDGMFDRLRNPVKRNEELTDYLNNCYSTVIKLRQNTIPNLPTVNLSFKDRKAERKSETTTITTDSTPIWSASTSSHGSTSSVPNTNDDHFWRDMFFMDQISDAIDDHDDWSHDDSNDFDGGSSWGNDDSSDFDSGSDWGNDDFGGSDWGGGDDFGGSDW